MDDQEYIRGCLDAIKWQRYRDGSYSSQDPLVAIKDKLYRMRDGSGEQLTRAELLLLRKVTLESIEYIKNRYHMPETMESAVRLRDYLQQRANKGE